jgi:hypothetical protein
MKRKTDPFFYTAAASRDFGLTDGSRDTPQIALADLGRQLVYAPDAQTEGRLKREAFLRIEKFRQVLEYYKGSELPEMQYLSNTLVREFELPEETHVEFSDLFRRNCDYLGIGRGFATSAAAARGEPEIDEGAAGDEAGSTVTFAEPQTETGLKCFVIMPFRERQEAHPEGFFTEVLRSLIAPAGRDAGFTVATASRQGSDVIQSTIVNELLDAELVLADLTEHNPNVLFELGLRMAHDKPVALIKARGTGAVFDVDNVLRVLEYDANLWSSTVDRDRPRLTEHIRAAWDNRDSENTYIRLLRRPPVQT